MAEYIEREALRKFPIRANHCDKAHADENFIFGIEAVLEYAEHIPAVEVVWCKNCVHWNHGDCYRLELSRPDDFCSYGERREDA